MNIRPGIIGYVPPPTFTGATVFLDNLKRFPTRNELILCSDHPYPECQIKLNCSPEKVENARAHPFAISNALFITGMKIAKAHGLTHVIYLESDCRVGVENWDQFIFNEFFNIGFPVIAAGSLVCWNPMNGGLDVARRWEELVGRNPKRNYPIATYGVRPQTNIPNSSPCIFPNGALGVYDISWMEKLWDLNDAQACIKAHAWDFQLGSKIWEKFGIDSFDMVGHLNSIFSSYANEITSEEERLTMLRNKDVVAVHQVKSEATV